MAKIVRDEPGAPLVVDLNVGDSILVDRTGHAVELELLGVKEYFVPDHWLTEDAGRVLFASAELELRLDATRHQVAVRPYAFPVNVAGLRLYGELTRTLTDPRELVPVGPFGHEARVSIGTRGEPWFWENGAFPIGDYRWHASSYRNTWNSLVPYNHRYHHRGEDFGAVPDQLPVLAHQTGTIVQCPAGEATGSNSVVVRGDDGLEMTYSHMNLGSIDPSVRPGASVAAGQRLGATGETWLGERRQYMDPHLHVGAAWRGHRLSCYPSLVEAYFRDYGDPVLAVAGGYAFAVPGMAVRLDGTRSLTCTTSPPQRWVWTTSKGGVVAGAVAERRYASPGHYVERLDVFDKKGQADFDHLQVRVYDPTRGPGSEQALAYGWCYHTPVRGIRPGDEVVLWNRLEGCVEPTVMDVGDGTAPAVVGSTAVHRFRAPGRYDVRFRSRSALGHPFETAMKVVVEHDSHAARAKNRWP